MNDCRIYLIAHAPLASALKACAEHVFADAAADLQVLDVQPCHDTAHWLAQADALFAPSPTAAGDAPVAYLLLTDVIGATPYNVARALGEHAAAAGAPVRILTGVNLPMLLRAITYRQENLEMLAERASSGAALAITTITP